MKIVTHKFQKSENELCYLVNLVDHTGRPLESHVAKDNDDKFVVAEGLTKKYGVTNVYHNTGFSIIE